ncbi:MAG: hypothetical protein JXD18_01885 [Anaerolineae bacterium]|nr:hypothetical protein [Anaerolineae bacterium]
MNSRETQTIDDLIVQALQAQVKDVQPPSRIWRRVRRRAMTWCVCRKPESSPGLKVNLAAMFHVESPFFPSTGRIRNDSVTMRMLELRLVGRAESFFRFV